MKYITFIKSGTNYEATIEPTLLQQEIDRLYAEIKVKHQESQELHGQLAQAEALMKELDQLH